MARGAGAITFLSNGSGVLKYEHVYLYAYGSVNEAKERLKVYLEFYSSKRPHQSLDGRTPNAVYFETAGAEKQAA